jgi:Glycolipid transfer protein (GLTP)
MWFFDFVSNFLNNLDADRKAAVSTCVQKAYDEALGIHHPFIVRAGAKVAMLASPNRKNLFKGMFGENMPDDDIYKFFQKAKELIDPIRKSLWGYYEDKKLTELP